MTYQNEPVPIEFLDKKRSLRFTIPAARRIKQDFGTDPVKWSKEEWGQVGESDRLPAILKALLLHEDKDITADQIADMLISSAQTLDATGAVMRAWAHFNGLSDAQYEALVTEAIKEAAGQPEAEPESPLATTVQE